MQTSLFKLNVTFHLVNLSINLTQIPDDEILKIYNKLNSF
jgi:propanediol dehydratase small subunit